MQFKLSVLNFIKITCWLFQFILIIRLSIQKSNTKDMRDVLLLFCYFENIIVEIFVSFFTLKYSQGRIQKHNVQKHLYMNIIIILIMLINFTYTKTAYTYAYFTLTYNRYQENLGWLNQVFFYFKQAYLRKIKTWNWIETLI